MHKIALLLPLLALAGYTPGTTDPQSLQALTLAYCALPCALKLLAAVMLYALLLRPSSAVGAAADRPHSPHTP